MRSEALRLTLTLALASGLAHAGEGLLGPSVGNADTFMSEGTKLYNQQKYAKAAENFLKATRANPALLPGYLQLARASIADKKIQRACYAYRVFLKNVPESPDRKKAQAESDQCERQLATAKGQPPDLSQKYVETRAAFFGALDQQQFLTTGGAADSLKLLIREGYLGPDLGDMGAKLGTSAVAAAEEIHKRALGLEKLPSDALRSARPLYQLASDVATAPADAAARMAFLDGVAALQDKDTRKADVLFTEAQKADASNKEYAFYRALALYNGSRKDEALKVLDADLKDDPRTATLRTALAISAGATEGAAALEKLLFSTRYLPEK
jgi:tetratricopeptide (TPR) repeat protein